MVAQNSNPADGGGDSSAHEARVRLVAGMLECLEKKSFANVTINDVVAAARVSKRTFYEHFDSKEDCFLAAYVAASTELMNAIDMAATDTSYTWERCIEETCGAYLMMLEQNPALSRAFLLEIHLAGEKAIKARREIHGRFAELLKNLVARARKDNPHMKPLSPKLAIALVGGINELVLVALESEGERLGALQGAAAELARAVILR